MKRVWLLIIVTAVAACLTAALTGAATASATVLCKKDPTAGAGETTGTVCPAGEAYPKETEIHAVNEGNVVLTTGSEFTEITCKQSTIAGKTENEGSSTETVKSNIEAKNMTFGECSTPNGNCTVTTVTGDTLEVHWLSGTHNGTLTSNGVQVTMSCASIFGAIHCIYVTEKQDLGTLTGGEAATIDIENTPISQTPTSSLCPTGTKLDAKYNITSPKPLYVADHGSTSSNSGGVFCKVEGTGSPTGTVCPAGEAYPKGTELHGVNEGSLVLTTGSEFTEITCKKSTIKGSTENEGGGTEAVKGEIATLSFEECATPNGKCTVTTVKGGTLEVGWSSGTHNGTLRSNGAEVTSSCASIFGAIHCLYVTAEEDFGTFTGGNPATTDSESVPISQAATSALCPSKPTWDAKYEITSPKPLYVAGHT